LALNELYNETILFLTCNYCGYEWETTDKRTQTECENCGSFEEYTITKER